MPASSARHTARGGWGPMPDAKVTDSKANEEAHWDKTTKLMLTHLGIWFFFGYVIHMFVVPLNKIIIPILGFPLGFYMAAQGSLIVFVVMLFMFAKQQDRIDREHGYAEEE
jgi:putative solute:sodium symporter small subunit